MQNVFTYNEHRNKIFGVAAADKLTHELLYNFIDRVAHAFPKLTFEVWGARRVDVTDVYGHQVGKVEIDFIGQYNRMVLELWSPRMVDKRNARAKTADLNKAVKMFAKYFKSNTDEELMETYSSRLDRVFRGLKDRSEQSLRCVMEEHLYRFFQTSAREKRYELYSLLALSEEQLNDIEDRAVEYFELTSDLLTFGCAVILKTPTGYLVTRSVAKDFDSAKVERVEEVPPEYRAQIGLLKLASYKEFIPKVGIKLASSPETVESYLCVNRNTTC